MEVSIIYFIIYLSPLDVYIGPDLARRGPGVVVFFAYCLAHKSEFWVGPPSDLPPQRGWHWEAKTPPLGGPACSSALGDTRSLYLFLRFLGFPISVIMYSLYKTQVVN